MKKHPGTYRQDTDIALFLSRTPKRRMRKLLILRFESDESSLFLVFDFLELGIHHFALDRLFARIVGTCLRTAGLTLLGLVL